MEQLQLKERYTFSDFLYWTMMSATPIFTGLLAIYRHSAGWFAGYIAVLIAMTAVLLRFYCTHCPHYLRDEKRLDCMFFRSMPKWFDPRPGPYRFLEKAAAFAACLAIVGFPAYWLLHEPGLLIICVLSWTVFILTIKKNECPRCIHKECPFNEAEKEN